MKYHVTIDGVTRVVELDAGAVLVDGEAVEAELVPVAGGPVASLKLGDDSHALTARHGGGDAWEIQIGAVAVHASIVDERTRVIREMTGSAAGASGPQPIRAPMPGLVVRVEVAQGDEVHEGQGVVIVEAMKMENELVAGGDAIVGRVHVSAGDAVEKDQLLVELAPAAEAEDEA